MLGAASRNHLVASRRHSPTLAETILATAIDAARYCPPPTARNRPRPCAPCERCCRLRLAHSRAANCVNAPMLAVSRSYLDRVLSHQLALSVERGAMRDPRAMNPLIFKPEPMGLEHLLLGLSLSERITYDQARNTIFINFEGFQVRTTADVDLVRREMEARCKAIGRKVALVANYDGFYLDPMVSDAYFSMITYMQNRYYSSASRYTTSAFMRLKLGAGLAERNLAPHVFETWPEAQAFSAAQPSS